MKRSTSAQSIDLKAAQDLILEVCPILPSERVGLADAVERVASQSHFALENLPGYDGSLRDGYAVGQLEENTAHPEELVFEVVDEVAAGDTRKLDLKEGEAIRIMTGGLIPAGCRKVIPQEKCERGEKTVRISRKDFGSGKTFIHKKASDVKKDQVILEKGVAVSADHVISLAGVGYEFVDVVRKPKVSFFCTGSELIKEPDGTIQAGQRFSGNNYLLSGLIPRYGAEMHEQEMVVDDAKQVVELMERMSDSDCDILVSTGGMGAGKFDLIEEAFASCGGETVYRSLNMRPGKSTLFGKLGETLFFGLPGPPPAVQLLFHELVRPAICRLQGAQKCRPSEMTAILTEELTFPQHGLLRLKSGQLSFEDGACLVRPIAKAEVSNCYIVCSSEKHSFANGEKVTIHLL